MNSFQRLGAPGMAIILGFWFGSVAQADSTRFMAVGDSQGNGTDYGVNDTIFSEIVQAAIDEAVDFFFFSGDLVDGSPDYSVLLAQLMHWRDLAQPLYDAGIGVYPCRTSFLRTTIRKGYGAAVRLKLNSKVLCFVTSTPHR